MKKMKQMLSSDLIKPLFKEFRIGLEKESQRITPDGELATTEHPKRIASRDIHPYIQTDFSETQMELITPVFDSSEETLRFLGALHDVTLRSLENGERLWPMSMPPVLPRDDKDIIIAKLSDQGDVNYRRYLAKVYGKRKQMVSGIHYNFEFSDEFLRALFKEQDEVTSFEEFRTNCYMKVSRQYLRYRWLVTYLYGASPFAEKGYFFNQPAEQPVRSFRNSHFGYTNRPEINVSYDSLENYVADINDLIDNGLLIEAKEFYSSVRLRGTDNIDELLTKGVSYIELRNIDLNPFAEYGISLETLDFLHLFMMTMLWLDETEETSESLLKTGVVKNEQVSLEHPMVKTDNYEEGLWLLNEMEKLATALNLPKEYLAVIEKSSKALEHPKETLAAQIVTEIESTYKSNKELATSLGNTYHERAIEKPYQLSGYRHMELSTQIMMFDAIQNGVKVEVLDENDQFLKLTYQGKVEYVKNANMTSKDSYIVPLLMENKTVTKKVLAKAGFRVPLGKEFSSMEKAEQAYDLFANKGFVVKPKSTNYGLGISIFKDGATFEDYKKALEIAFSEDVDLLVEEFLPGTEYRFFVLDGKTRAILLRVPANVVGDGKRTVTELVNEKNKDSLRGTHHRSPLEIIQLGDIEQLMLKEQGLTIDSIPAVDQVVYLRENSNVSTGGDSIDVTDDMDESYKKIAEEAVEALGAKICGIDLIIPDKTIKGNKKDTSYGIIEGNFNPAMHMHIYPFAGTGRRLTMDVLGLLYPDIKR
ncbi:bifunctional glutamate--cysteine ligase GshA/glutathione synthetase GshB [Vagococcus fluvialis]|uniref:bifunctional glutamate--cysteine ligase GshA/glutathione synthetase GshB n=1 Tax=Vagococcus fluvialis TaxID=2738 RepID=UPI001D0A74BE|nr:bifunctional glutamate--cysteine ligase GshA/glutathione synthetase GshB [Vagococcus fluvialis]UDM74252.1 bifunctional glutamate--cysteine ligase GshA/glutathione synthetase GshB [Vagococcus fluvialis]